MATKKKKDEDVTAPPTDKADDDSKDDSKDEGGRVVPISSGRGPGRPRKSEQLDEAARILDDNQARLASFMAPFAPIVSGVTIEYAEANTHAVLTLARSHPKVLQSILALAEFDALLALGTYLLALVVAVGVELRFVNAEGMTAQLLGVSEVWAKIESERADYQKRTEEFYGAGDDAGAGNGKPSIPGLMGDISAAPAG